MSSWASLPVRQKEYQPPLKSDSDLIQPGCEIVVPTKSERKRLQLSEIMGMSSMTATIAAMVATLTNAFK